MNYATRRMAELQAPGIAEDQRRPVREVPALLALLIMAAVLAGCASPVTAGPSATPTTSRAAAASTPAAARTFTSRRYGYTDALPAGWRLARQATRPWNGTGGPGTEDSVVDLFYGPGGLEAWAVAVPSSAWPPTLGRPSAPPPPPTHARRSRKPTRPSRSAAHLPG